MSDLNYIVVAGFGWSGSGAVVDLLKEYNGLIDPGVEFRLIKDPYGIEDLHNAIIRKGDPLNVDIAINDFLWYTRKLYDKVSKWNLHVGLNYKKCFGDDFLIKTSDYVSALSDFRYESHWWMYEFKESKFNFLFRKICNHISRNKKTEKLYFSVPTEKKFLQETKKYLDSLFNKYINFDTKSIVLDQGVSPQNYDNELRYLGNAKIIIVDRDPRDIYTDLCVGGNLIGIECSVTRDAQKYITWHEGHRRNCKRIESENALYIQFEDLINNYEETVKKIEDFLGLSGVEHIQKKQFFIPIKSKKNIGIWKKYMNNKELRVFDEYLSDYYYKHEK